MSDTQQEMPACIGCGCATKHYGDFLNYEYECPQCGEFTLRIVRVPAGGPVARATAVADAIIEEQMIEFAPDEPEWRESMIRRIAEAIAPAESTGPVTDISVNWLPYQELPYVGGHRGGRDVWLRDDGVWVEDEGDERNSLEAGFNLRELRAAEPVAWRVVCADGTRCAFVGGGGHHWRKDVAQDWADADIDCLEGPHRLEPLGPIGGTDV